MENKWKDERELQMFLFNNPNVLEAILSVKIINVKKEVHVPFGTSARLGRAASLDLLAVDTSGKYHIIEVKHPKNELLDNTKGLAQLLFYDALLSEKQGIEASMTLVTSSFDIPCQNIIPRNKLNINFARVKKQGDTVLVEKIVEYTPKEGVENASACWKPIC